MGTLETFPHPAVWPRDPRRSLERIGRRIEELQVRREQERKPRNEVERFLHHWHTGEWVEE